ncbi:MAG: hydrogenase maturation protease [Gammaproteobacteria bacterium]|nr:hydrogenase maturation protease [Gammaproteobacteria bacterium]
MLDPLENTRPILVFAYGNPSRGDDALGPELLQRLDKKLPGSSLKNKIELQTDFQLQIEHTLDMKNRQLVIFVDASLKPENAFHFSQLSSEKDDSYTSHAMSPAALLNLFEQIHPDDNPAVYLLAIRGYQFELGKAISKTAENNLQQALEYLHGWLTTPVNI